MAIASISCRARAARRRPPTRPESSRAKPGARRSRPPAGRSPRRSVATVVTIGAVQPAVPAAIDCSSRSCRATWSASGPVGLVHHEDVGHLEDAGLGRLDAVAQAGRQQHQRRVGQPGPRPPRTDRRRRSRSASTRSRPRPAPATPAGRPRPCRRAAPGWPSTGRTPRDRSACSGHPDPVAEQRAAGERRRRVDRQHARPGRPRSRSSAHQCRGGGGLADAGRAGQADHLRVPPACGASSPISSGSSGESSSTSEISRPTARRPADRALDQPARSARPIGPRGSTPRPAEVSAEEPGGSGRRPGRRRRTARPHPTPPPRRLQLQRQVQRDPGAGHADRVTDARPRRR